MATGGERPKAASRAAPTHQADIIVLKGEIESHIDSGYINDPPVTVPPSLLGRADELYLLGQAGGRLLQAIGMVNSVAQQTLRFQKLAPKVPGMVLTRSSEGDAIWENNVDTLKLCIMNLDEVIELFNARGERGTKS